MSKKTATIVWHIASNRLIRKGNGWFCRPRYEVSTQWETKLSDGLEVQNIWKHKTFTELQKAFDYYMKIEEGKL